MKTLVQAPDKSCRKQYQECTVDGNTCDASSDQKSTALRGACGLHSASNSFAIVSSYIDSSSLPMCIIPMFNNLP